MLLHFNKLEKRLITVSEYHKMIEAEIFTTKDKIELLNGELIYRNITNPKKSSHLTRTNALFHSLLTKQAIISVKNSITIFEYSEPEPHIAILKRKENFYSDRHPYPEDVYLVIEFAEDLIFKERKIKLPIYATANIKEYWIVNLVDTCIEVYKNPKKDTYTNKSTFYKGDEIELDDFKVKIKVSDILK